MQRDIGLFEATSWGVGIILGAGIYVLIGEAAGIAGNAVWLSFILGAVVASLTGLSYAELASLFPREAAEYVYVKIACGCEILSFIVGWLTVITGIISVAAVALGFSGYFSALFGVSRELVAILLIGGLSSINFIGIKESTRINVVFTGIELAGLVLIVVLGIGRLGTVNLLESPQGVSGILSASALIFFAYLGFEDVVNIAEESKNPEKTIPIALILSVIVTTILYALVAIATVSLADWRVLSFSSAPLAYAASQALGETIFGIMSIIALFATSNTVLIMLVVGSRMIYGMAREAAFPRVLARLHPTTRTPWVAIILTMITAIVFVFIGDLELIASVTSFGAFITFLAVNIALLYVRYRQPNASRPFKIPVNIYGFPVTGFLGIISCLFLVLQFDVNVLISGSVFVIIGFIVYGLTKVLWKRGS